MWHYLQYTNEAFLSQCATLQLTVYVGYPLYVWGQMYRCIFDYVRHFSDCMFFLLFWTILCWKAYARLSFSIRHFVHCSHQLLIRWPRSSIVSVSQKFNFVTCPWAIYSFAVVEREHVLNQRRSQDFGAFQMFRYGHLRASSWEDGWNWMDERMPYWHCNTVEAKSYINIDLLSVVNIVFLSRKVWGVQGSKVENCFSQF